MSRNVDLLELPLDRLCNFVWWWATRNGEQKDRDAFERRLWIPPKGEVAEGVWSAENEMGAFSQLKAQVNAG